MNEQENAGLNFYLDDEGQNPSSCKLDLQGGLSPEVQVFPTGLSPDEVDLVEALLAINPDRTRTLLNHISKSAYALGLEHGREEASFSDGIIGSLNISVPQPGTFARLVAQVLQYENSSNPSTQEVADRLNYLQEIEDDIVKREPGSGSAFLDLPNSRPVDQAEQSFVKGVQEAIDRIDAMPIAPILKLPE